MKVLVLGAGAREHTLAWKFSKSKRISGLFTAPGNAGTGEISENISGLDPMDIENVVNFCRELKINIVFVGPEAPLAAGVVDALSSYNIPVIGPPREAAKLESSKAFSKSFMLRHNIPTASAREFSSKREYQSFIYRLNGKVVVKKSGLASGKGVLESDNREELLRFGNSILDSDLLLVEEFLEGWEVSIFTITDGKSYLFLPPCADFKKAMDGDRGPNTGGMGAICPVPAVSSELLREIELRIIEPTFRGMKKEGLTYKGVLYFGLIITDEGPKVLEYNVRFGDPETQVLLPLIDSDFGDLADAIIQEKLEEFPLIISDNSAVGVVIASGGYPGKYKKNIPVKNIPRCNEKELLLFHASTIKDNNNRLLTNGGRCFTVVGLSKDLLHASAIAYEAAPRVVFDSAWYRNDIGIKFFY
ncbi:MAG: phosphoribosylamine--glycine ligase [Spirochaetes bacterium]|nr:MAG: phosphoribosylamine--glycine ligase [Spirochaetota bacterium]